MALSPRDKVRILQFAISWQTESWNAYCIFIKWLDEHSFLHDGVISAAQILAEDHHRAPTTTFGTMKTSLSRDFLASLARFALRQGYSTGDNAFWAIRSMLKRLHLSELNRGRKRMNSFFFFDVDAISSCSRLGCLFDNLYPSQRDFCDAKFLVILSFTAMRGYHDFLGNLELNTLLKAELRDFLRRTIVYVDHSCKVLAIGHVPDRSQWGARRWKAKTVPAESERRLLDLIFGNQDGYLTSVNFEDLISDSESKDVGYVTDYLVQLGLVHQEEDVKT